MDWKLARCGAEVGLMWFRRYDADEYCAWVETAEGVQDAIVASIDRLARTTRDSDMSVTSEALDEHWRQAEWERAS